ncbi:hypothetical protein PoB_003597200, partial [Plakobranchus ocellatus]
VAEELSDMENAAPCPDTSSAGHRDIHIVLDFAAYKDSSILTDVTVVVCTTEFKCHRLRGSSNFNSFDTEDMKYLICSDRLNLAHEDDLIETFLQWAENDPHARSIDDTHAATSEDRRAESSVTVQTVDVASDKLKVAESPGCELNKPYQAPGPGVTRVLMPGV